MSVKEYRVTIAAGATQRLPVRGNGFFLKEPGGGVVVRFDAGNEQFDIRQNEGVRNLPNIFKEAHLSHDQPVAIEIVFTVGVGEFFTNTMSGAFAKTPNVGISALPKLAMTGGIDTIAANANRKKINITVDNNAAGVVWLGGVVDSGNPLEAGDQVTLEVTGAIDLLGTNAGDIVYIFEEI